MEELRKVTIALTVLAVGLICSSAYCQDETDPSDKWEVRLMPYVFFLSLDAEGTIDGLSADADLSFDDIVDNLDFGAMGRLEAWKGKWGLSFDGLFVNLGADKRFRGRSGLVDFTLDADFRLGWANFGLMYRLFEKPFGKNNEQRLVFEPYGGLRYVYIREKIGLDVDIPGIGSAGRNLGTSEDYVEPFVGGRVILDLNEKLALNIRGDAGGTGERSDSWQILGGMDYKLSKNVTFNAGYRYIELNYSRGSGADEFGIDLRAKGPVVGMTIVF